MTPVLVFLVLFSLCRTSQAQPDLSSLYDYTVNLTAKTLDANGLDPHYYVLYYSVRSTSLHVGIVCYGSPSYWCAFGISTDGNMIGSVATIGWVDPATSVTHVEGFLLGGQNAPDQTTCTQNTGSLVCPADSKTPNCSSHISNISGSRSGDYQTIEFVRPLTKQDSCDLAIALANQNIIWAIGTTCVFSLCGVSWPYNINKHLWRAQAPPSNFHQSFLLRPTTGTTGVPSTNPHVTTGIHTTGMAAATSGQVVGCAGLDQYCLSFCGGSSVVTCRCGAGNVPEATCATKHSTSTNGISDTGIIGACLAIVAIEVIISGTIGAIVGCAKNKKNGRESWGGLY